MSFFSEILKNTAALFALCLLAGCTGATHIKALSKDSNNNYSESDKLLIASLKKQSDDLHIELKKRGLIYSDKESNEYISSLGRNLAPEFMTGGNVLKFYIIKDATANAMALPNNNIYLNIGLLAVVESEAQLATILAHEISHVIQQHSLKSRLNRQETILAANIADIFLLGTGLSYLPAISNISSFSREQEKDADLLGLKHLRNAGYDLNQAPDVFKVFQTLPEVTTIEGSAYSSHPQNKQRIELIEKVVNEQYTGYNPHHKESEAFTKIRKKVVETHVKIRLHNNQYELALNTLDKAEAYYSKAALIQFYRAEAFRLKADNPRKAAEEIKWLYPEFQETKNIEYFIKNKPANYQKAESLYNDAIKMNPNLSLSYRGNGLLNYSNNNYTAALSNLNKYLELNKKPEDSLYIKRLIRNINRKLGSKHND